MTIASDMKLVLATVVTDLGEVWTHASRTSKRDITPPVFGAFSDIAALALDMTEDAQEDEPGDKIVELLMVRVPATANVKIGDRMKDPGGREYHVSEQVSSGYGTDRFMIKRAHRDALGSIREGGF